MAMTDDYDYHTQLAAWYESQLRAEGGDVAMQFKLEGLVEHHHVKADEARKLFIADAAAKRAAYQAGRAAHRLLYPPKENNP